MMVLLVPEAQEEFFDAMAYYAEVGVAPGAGLRRGKGDSWPSSLPVARMSGMVRNSHDQDNFHPDDEGEIIWKPRQADTPPALFTKSPKQRVLHDGGTRVLHLVAKSDTESRNLSLIIPCDALDLSFGLGMKFQNEVHRSGAIPRSLRKTSDAGVPFTRPES